MPTGCTFGPLVGAMAFVKASQDRISVISFIKAFVSLELVDFDRSWLIFASKLGCWETWTLGGKDMVKLVLETVQINPGKALQDCPGNCIYRRRVWDM